jgi:hypothetical protein
MIEKASTTCQVGGREPVSMRRIPSPDASDPESD